MARIDYSKYAGKQQGAAFQSFSEFLKDAAENSWIPVKPKGVTTLVHESKAGNPQIAFRGEDGSIIFVRISSALDAALKAGEEGVSLPKQPVYEVALDNGGFMLVVGMKGQSTEWETVDVKNLSKYKVSKRPEVSVEVDD